MINIPLYSKNEIVAHTKIDNKLYDTLKESRYNLSNTGYAISTKGKLLHRLITDANKNEIVDHINGDKLDNRKENLRIVSRSCNSHNKLKKDNLTSNFIGVSFRKDKNTWRCSISYNYKLEQISFEKEEHAAYWYDQLALKYYGDNAKINNIEKPPDFVEPIYENKDLPIGVTKNRNKYIARIGGKYLGQFDTIDEAKQKYENSKEKSKIETKVMRNLNNIAIIKIKDTEILVDDDKYQMLVKYKWKMDNNNYPFAKVDNKLIRMHRLVIEADENDLIDHINRNKNDNRISNLRKSNSQLNNHNKTKKSNCSSSFKGVSLNKKTNKFVSSIRHNNKQIYLGTFYDEIKAAEAYNKKAIELYGNYANLNIIP